MNRFRILIVLALLVAVGIGIGFWIVQARSLNQPIFLPQQDLVIETHDGKRHVFHVEIALTREDQQRGLMFRDHLGEDQGMIFVNQIDGVSAMWMKNTLIPLDMVFIAANGQIVNIIPDARPGDLTPLLSNGPVRATLEIGGGIAKKWGIQAGDRVIQPIFEK